MPSSPAKSGTMTLIGTPRVDVRLTVASIWSGGRSYNGWSELSAGSVHMALPCTCVAITADTRDTPPGTRFVFTSTPTSSPSGSFPSTRNAP